MTAEAIRALETAARSSRHLFRAASLIARMYTEQGRLDQAIEWFERGAEAPASSIEDGRRLLYELGRTLEANNEVARALAVYLELQADAGDYRDLAPRVGRLSKLQAKG
jgi:tetratricopeptide (TPR) repeat protein